MSRHQHGRKPQKSWHKRSSGRRLLRALSTWPVESNEPVEYGEPTPLRQGRSKRRGMAS